MDNFERKIMNFAVALKDVYRDEDERESIAMPKMELKEEELTEDFTAMIYAQWALYRQITDDDVDIFGFTHLMNRLVLQKLMADKGVSLD